MTARLPGWLRHDNVAADRLLVAAWLWHVGEIDTALTLAGSVVLCGDPQRTLERVAERVAEREACWEDPALYAWVTYSQARPGAGLTWLEWGEDECDHITADLRALAGRLAVEGVTERSAA